MFGYVSIDRPELKVREFETFRAYYCGLCREIGKDYSELARFTLSYDCTFLYILTAALSESVPVYEKKRCTVKPVRKKPYALDEGADYAAAVNVMLAVGNLKDNVKDEGSLPSRAMLGLYHSAYKKAKAKYPDIEKAIEEALNALDKLEKQKTENIDMAADAFAGMLGEIFRRVGASEKILYNMGYNMGRWIYLIDAYQDVEKDAKTNAYNPFLCKYGSAADKEELKENAKYSLYSSLSGAVAAYDLLELKKHKGILDNIMYLGLSKKTEQILNGGRGTARNGSV